MLDGVLVLCSMPVLASWLAGGTIVPEIAYLRLRFHCLQVELKEAFKQQLDEVGRGLSEDEIQQVGWTDYGHQNITTALTTVVSFVNHPTSWLSRS